MSRTDLVLAVNDEARVLNSLQKPRRISIRGSDGKTYFLLCKPNDDLRKDQRLMEYNALINRFLKRDLQSSTRQLCELSRPPQYEAAKLIFSDRCQNICSDANQ